MALHTETRRAGPFHADGSTVVFPFDFKLFLPEEIVVNVSYDGGVTESAINSDLYTVALNVNQDEQPGGFVSFKTAPAAGVYLSVVSDVDYFQPTVFTNRGGFYPEILNESLDRLTILTQQLKEKVDRALVVASTSEMTSEELLSTLYNIAATANEYAQKAEETYNATVATKALVEQIRVHVDQQKSKVDASEAEVEEDRIEVQQMLRDAQKVNEVTQQFLPHVNELVAVGDSIEDVRVVASELQGLPIESMDLGRITDAATPVYDSDGSNVKKLADNIALLQLVVDNIESIQTAVNAAHRAEAAAVSAEEFAGEAETTVERVKEIEKTDFEQIYQQGVS